jgi:hypothetical protein
MSIQGDRRIPAFPHPRCGRFLPQDGRFSIHRCFGVTDEAALNQRSIYSNRHPREGGEPADQPAHLLQSWVPAFAGMTEIYDENSVRLIALKKPRSANDEM